MHKITTKVMYTSVDCLGNFPLEEGEMLKVKWKDGTISEEMVFVDTKETYRSNDDLKGTPFDSKISKAYFIKTIDNINVRVYLSANKDLLCERVYS